MLYTLGYRGLSGIPELVKIADKLEVNVILDVRFRPYTLGKWNSARLEKALGERRYRRARFDLGGFGHVTEKGLAALQDLDAQGWSVLLLCAEEAPGDCHRHHDIALPLHARGVEVLHIFEGLGIYARDLDKHTDDSEYTVLI